MPESLVFKLDVWFIILAAEPDKNDIFKRIINDMIKVIKIKGDDFDVWS